MTVTKRDEIRKNIRTGFNVANFILIVTSVFYIGSWVGGVEEQNLKQYEETKTIKSEVTENKIRIKQQYEDIRMLYVPRTEIEGQYENIIRIMTEMKKDIKDNRN